MSDYLQALVSIFQRADFERGERPPYAARTWRLARVADLLAALGDPHKRYPSVHIAGTKGKGSTTAMVESMLRAGGYRTGMYTSPHLHTFRERIRIDGRPICAPGSSRRSAGHRRRRASFSIRSAPRPPNWPSWRHAGPTSSSTAPRGGIFAPIGCSTRCAPSPGSRPA